MRTLKITRSIDGRSVTRSATSLLLPPLLRLPLRAVVLLLLLGLAAETGAQTSLEMSQLQLRYRVLSRSTKPDESARAELKKLEASALQARASGQTGLLYRDLHKAIALMEGKPWSAQDEYLNSLQLATEMTVCDPAQPWRGRIAQRYPAPADAKRQLTAHVFLAGLPPARPGRASAAAGQRLGEFPNLPADLTAKPFPLTVSLGELKEGRYVLRIELRDGAQTLHRLFAPLFVVRGLDLKQKAIEPRLERVKGFDSAKASIRYPFDLARTLNLGRTSVLGYDFPENLAKSEHLLATIESGKDPFAGAAGNLERHYDFKEASEIMPYRVYVPKSYDGKKPYPLIIALHGLGGTESTMMNQGNGALPKLAEQHGYLVATPLGYRRNGGYGRLGPGRPADPETARMVELSEKDVMNVLKLVRTEYQVDPARIYLTGHSMGGNGTWTLGTKYADLWAALAPIAGGSTSAEAVNLQRLKENKVPVMVVHGDADRTAPVDASRAMVAAMKKLGIAHEYIEVAGGGHGDVVGPNLPKIVEFFNRHLRGAR